MAVHVVLWGLGLSSRPTKLCGKLKPVGHSESKTKVTVCEEQLWTLTFTAHYSARVAPRSTVDHWHCLWTCAEWFHPVSATEHYDQKQAGEESVYLAYNLGQSPLVREGSPGTQAGTYSRSQGGTVLAASLSGSSLAIFLM